MKAYELLFFTAPSIDEESKAGMMSRIKSVIAEGKGSIDKVDDWGKKKLAYDINKLSEGEYTLIDFHANPNNISELDRVLRINDYVERHMITRRSDRD